MPVIDAHSHIYPDKIACKASSAVGDFYGVDMNAKNASASSMLAACEGSPITHHLVHSVATTPGQVPIINDFIAEQCRAHDNFVGFATMHQDFEDVEGEINRAIDLGLKGVKIHPDTQKVNMDDPRLMHLYEVIEGRLPIVIHTGDYRYDLLASAPPEAHPAHVPEPGGGRGPLRRLVGVRLRPRSIWKTRTATWTPPAPWKFLGPRRTVELAPRLRRRARDVRQRLPHVEPRRPSTTCSPPCPSPRRRVRSHHLAQRPTLPLAKKSSSSPFSLEQRTRAPDARYGGGELRVGVRVIAMEYASLRLARLDIYQSDSRK